MNYLILNRLDEIAHSVSKTEGMLALLALGSIGKERERIDRFSDLDFFIICKKGYKDKFINNLNYLDQIAPVDFKFKNTVDGYKLLYSDGCFCEFAIFETEELNNIPFSEGKIVWMDESFDPSVCLPQKLPQANIDIEWIVGEILTNIYIGLGRFYRGEKISAFNFIQCYARDRVLDLISILETPSNGISADIFAIERRFELRYPKYSDLISDIMQGYDKSVVSAEKILEFVDKNFEINPKIKMKINNLINEQNKIK